MSVEIVLAGIAGAAVFFLLWFLRALLKETRQRKPSNVRRIEAPFVVILPKLPSHAGPADQAARIQRGA